MLNFFQNIGDIPYVTKNFNRPYLTTIKNGNQKNLHSGNESAHW
jgi:hypothetical protein